MQHDPTPTLSARERDILYLLVHGHTAAQAAALLGVDPAEVGAMLETLQARIGVTPRHARTKLIVRAMIQSWV